MRDAFAGFITTGYGHEKVLLEFDVDGETEWYYQNDEGGTAGPVNLETLRKMYHDVDVDVDESTFVWCEEIDAWRSIGSIPLLMNAFRTEV